MKKRILCQTAARVLDIFNFQPQGRSEAAERLHEIRASLRPDRDMKALRGDFYRVGIYIRNAMVKYGQQA